MRVGFPRYGIVGDQFVAAGRVMYRLVEVEAFEESCLRRSTSSLKIKQQIPSVSSI
ncbi:hypothetical protein [Zhongshania sp.]|uniref:hypothetical protein n=1 Tax=Zhongshania sp. TaxID=1971902 RepID=UPI00356A3E60